MNFQNQKQRQKKIKKRFLTVLTLSVFLMLLISCGTTQKAVVKLPDIDFPTFPIELKENTVINYTDETKETVIIKNKDKEDVLITSWFFFALVDYDIEVQLAYEKYKYLKEHSAGISLE